MKSLSDKGERLTYCRLCEPMCGLRVEFEGSRVRRIRGDPEHPLSRGWLCRRGAAFREVHNDPDRLRRPWRRGAAGLGPVGWEEALTEVAGKLNNIRKTYGPDAVAVYMGNPMAFCTYGALSVPAFARALGTSQVFTSGSQDCNNKFAAAQRVFGSPVLQPIPDLDHVNYLLILGANPAVSGMSFIQAPRPTETLRKIRSRGGEIVVVDPRRTETANLGSEHLFINPDTDCFFLLSILWVLVDRGLVDRRWVDEDPASYQALEEVIRRWPPERTEPITGISSRKTAEIAMRLAGSEPSATYASVGINLGRNGSLTYWLVLALNLLAGHFDRRGGSFFCRGALDTERLFRWAGIGKNTRRSRIGDFVPVMGTYPAALLAHEILNKEQRPRVRALVVVAGNPLLSVPNEAHLKKAFSGLDLLVCLDIYRNETGALAHYLLPTTDFLEREDFNLSHTGLQLRRFAAYSPAVAPVDGGQRQEWEILEDLCARMGLPLWGPGVKSLCRAWGGAQDIYGRIGNILRRTPEARRGPAAPRAVPGMIFGLLFRMIGEIRFGELQSSARGLILEPHEFGRFRARSVRGRGPKVRLAPQDLVQEARKLEGYLSVRQAEQGRLLLIGMRERHTHNTWMHNADGLVRDATTNYLFIHPEDASARGIREGDLVEVDGLEGDRVRVPCRLTSDLKPGVIALPHGWGHNGTAGWQRANRRPGVNVNRLATDSVRRLEPVAGMAWLTGLPVEIRKVQEARLNSGHRE